MLYQYRISTLIHICIIVRNKNYFRTDLGKKRSFYHDPPVFSPSFFVAFFLIFDPFFTAVHFNWEGLNLEPRSPTARRKGDLTFQRKTE